MITFILVFVYAFTFFFIFKNEVITIKDGEAGVFNSKDSALNITAILLFCLAIITLVTAYIGSIPKREVGPIKIENTAKSALTFLIISTIFLIGFISFPIYVTGGSIDSIYGSQLITLCTLSVIIARSRNIRILIIFITLGIYSLFTFNHVGIELKDEAFHDKLYLGMIVINIIIAILLGSKGTVMFNVTEEEIKKEQDRQIIKNKEKLDKEDSV